MRLLRSSKKAPHSRVSSSRPCSAAGPALMFSSSLFACGDGSSDVLPISPLAGGYRHDDEAPQPHADDRGRAISLGLRRGLSRAVRVLVGQRHRPRAIVALPVVVVREAVVVPELALLLGRQ